MTCIPAPDPEHIAAELNAWKRSHPEATLLEVEHEVDRQLSGLRAAMIGDGARAEASTAVPTCPRCGVVMHRDGHRTLRKTTAQVGQLELTGQGWRCPACRAGLSPLGARLGLVPGRLSPAMTELALRIGAQLPFATAAELLMAACGTPVTHDTVRRLTERAGACWRHLELDQARALETAAHPPRAAAVVPPERDPVQSLQAA